MQTAIVRHILVKDKDLAEQLKRSYKMVPTSQKLPSNIPPVIRQNVAVNLAKSKKDNLCQSSTKLFLQLLNVFYKAQSKASLAIIF